jgi:hypothetical protein
MLTVTAMTRLQAAIAKSEFALLAPHGYQLVDLDADTVLELNVALVGSWIMIRNGSRVDVAKARRRREDKTTNVQNNYVVQYEDDTMALCVKNRAYSDDWQLVVSRDASATSAAAALSPTSPSTAPDAPLVRVARRRGAH